MLPAVKCATALACMAGASAQVTLTPIKHIITLMFENRAFDHLLGHLGLTDPRVDGLQNAVPIPIDPANPSSPSVGVNQDVVDEGPSDLPHDFDSITFQVFGFAKPENVTAPVKMDGFAKTAPNVKGAMAFAMSAYNATTLPVMSTLATEFAVFDHWHASVPGPTNCNREYMMSGTSHGMTNNSFPDEGFPQPTHFNFLSSRGFDWKIYYSDDPWMAPAFADLRTPESLARVQEIPSFFSDLTNGTLPRYSLIQPRMASSPTGPSNWQHPDNSVEAGEAFLGEVYAALRASPYWEESLLIITYDEHGGFYDHQKTPVDGIPSPDGIVSWNGFAFDRLGVRIPTVLVSPWIKKGTVVNAPSPAQAPTATSQWESTSIVATTNRLFGISDNMTARDAWAATFIDIVDGSSGLRTDCPMTMPAPKPVAPAQLAKEMVAPLNDHHLDSLNTLCHLSSHSHPVCRGYPHAVEQAAFAAGLAEGTGRHVSPPDAFWEHAAEQRHLHAPVARLLRQQDFGDLSREMWATYKAKVMGDHT